MCHAGGDLGRVSISHEAEALEPCAQWSRCENSQALESWNGLRRGNATACQTEWKRSSPGTLGTDP